ncbi:cation efflux protein [Xylaria telfairii]|nr:cation efflux protein [Xylaria telfairii]
MVSSYALPQAPLPHNHSTHSSIDHLHTHSSHSHSPPSFGRSRSRSSLSNGSVRSHSYSYSHSHGHGHSHSNESIDEDAVAHARQNMSQYHANSFVPLQRRENRPSPLRQNTEELPSLGEPEDRAASPHKDIHCHDNGHHHDHVHNHIHSHDHEHDHEHDREHSHHDHWRHTHQFSRLTGLLLLYTSKWPLVHAIMTDKDSRRIFYFMGVNFSFMTVQAVYGYLTDSLGLLSDSIHMFFDCVALAVGLFASVMSKWSPSERFPYGFGKVETLSGFANGVFLILISLEIMFEAFERLLEGRETKRLGELFVVSTMGLIVNLLGIFAFGSHGHHHGHSHDHPHQHHGHTHAHGHNHNHDHNHDGGASQKHGHNHAHDNENMHGIYLHILADTLGSASVIASTALTYLMPWSGWDPLASFLIAYLILITAMPLVKSSAQRLLLTNTADTEYNLRNTLSEITSQRGVASYSVPKFWADDRADSESGGRLLGVMHVVAMRGSDLEEVRDRVKTYLSKQGIDVTVQVEREGDGTCWCGMGRMSPLSPRVPGGF